MSLILCGGAVGVCGGFVDWRGDDLTNCVIYGMVWVGKWDGTLSRWICAPTALLGAAQCSTQPAGTRGTRGIRGMEQGGKDGKTGIAGKSRFRVI